MEDIAMIFLLKLTKLTAKVVKACGALIFREFEH